MRVAVVGGGAVGLTAAHDLARDGEAVTLFERGSPGSGSTGRASGVLYDAFTEAVDARIAERSLERFRDLSGEGTFRFEPTPYVWVATEAGSTAEAIRDGAARMQAHGLHVDLVDPDSLGRRYPGVRLDDVEVAAVAWDAGRTEPATYAETMAALAREAGVDLREGSPVGVRYDPPRVVELDERGEPTGERWEFDAVLVAAGVHTAGVLADAGIEVPLKPYRVQALVTAGTGGLTTADTSVPMLYDAGEGYYLRPHEEGLLAGDGTVPVEVDPDDWERDGDDWFVDAMETRLADRLVDWDGPVDRAWAGLCAATPDGDPLLGELTEGLFVAAGWQGHGFMRTPGMAEQISAQIRGGDGVPAFDPDRFEGDESFEIVEGMAVE